MGCFCFSVPRMSQREIGIACVHVGSCVFSSLLLQPWVQQRFGYQEKQLQLRKARIHSSHLSSVAQIPAKPGSRGMDLSRWLGEVFCLWSFACVHARATFFRLSGRQEQQACVE